ncbi:DUF190 domain-containing protein [Sulfuriferula nivalis]|uniref:DUF190 domain-containing protein n=1 Tax=Sulfuriferula nivalis TaxID=2675298 RepID=A0A809RGV6_9PROT|nr:DUF190 domain-containing protein [Sulfuriferula nivalis]BBP00094.1 hypothetical protein SFSGTM_08020 [Sulfuriferula nivalis]
MTQVCLRFYSSEGRQHHGKLLHVRLLEIAHEMEVSGGTVTRASAGFGRHGMAEDSFFELGGELPEIIEFIANQAQVDELIAWCREQQLNLFYTVTPVISGYTGE